MPEVIDVVLRHGWIDGLRHKHDDVYFRQRMTPRKSRSRWSQINREKAEVLIAAGRMRPAGLREVDAAKADGRWDAAYAGARTIEVPDDMLADGRTIHPRGPNPEGPNSEGKAR